MCKGVKDLLDKVNFNKGNFTILKDRIIKERYILKNIIIKVFHKYNLPSLKLKIIDMILKNYDKNIKLCMSKEYSVIISDETISFVKN